MSALIVLKVHVDRIIRTGCETTRPLNCWIVLKMDLSTTVKVEISLCTQLNSVEVSLLASEYAKLSSGIWKCVWGLPAVRFSTPMLQIEAINSCKVVAEMISRRCQSEAQCVVSRVRLRQTSFREEPELNLFSRRSWNVHLLKALFGSSNYLVVTCFIYISTSYQWSGPSLCVCDLLVFTSTLSAAPFHVARDTEWCLRSCGWLRRLNPFRRHGSSGV